jgi:hypothetical protein
MAFETNFNSNVYTDTGTHFINMSKKVESGAGKYFHIQNRTKSHRSGTLILTDVIGIKTGEDLAGCNGTGAVIKT